MDIVVVVQECMWVDTDLPPCIMDTGTDTVLQSITTTIMVTVTTVVVGMVDPATQLGSSLVPLLEL
jgi:hypothetical protein